MIGTSGTILALGAMAHQMETGEVAEVLHHVTVRPTRCTTCASGSWLATCAAA